MNKDEIAEKAAEELADKLPFGAYGYGSKEHYSKLFLPIIKEACRKAREENERRLKALEVLCYFRPHPKIWWDGEMNQEHERVYNFAYNFIGSSLFHIDLDSHMAALTPKETKV